MEIARIVIPQHVRKIKISEHRRAIYFTWNGISIGAFKSLKVPRAFFRDQNNYPDDILIEDLKPCFCITIINEKKKIVDYIKENKRLPTAKGMAHYWKYILYSNETGKWLPVIANKKTVGTPNMYLINGQDIYNGVVGEFKLQTVMNAIKDCYRPFIKDLLPITEYPIDISCEIHDTIKNFYDPSKTEAGHRWDVDNYAYPYLKAFPDLLVKEGKIRDDDRLHIPQSIPAIFCPVEKHEDRKLVFIIKKTERSEIIDNRIYKEYHSPKVDTGYYKLNKPKEDEEFPYIIR